MGIHQTERKKAVPSITIHLEAAEPVSLPIDDFHLRQGLMYHLLRENEELSQELHNTPAGVRNVYKMLTYSPLNAEKRIFTDEFACLQGRCSWEIRSVRREIIETIAEAALKSDVLRLGQGSMLITGIELKDMLLRTPVQEIIMESPIVIHHTDSMKNRHYISPLEDDFEEMVNQNFRRKYAAYLGCETDESIRIRLNQRLTNQERYIGRFKSVTVCGFYGRYILEGSPDALTFLYHCGLGVRNAEGFGFFNVLPKLS